MLDPTMSYLETEKRKYPICYNLNVMEEIQNKYGSIQAWGNLILGKEENEAAELAEENNAENKKEIQIKDMKFGLMAMINEAIDITNEENKTNEPFVTLKQVGRILTEIGLKNATQKVMQLTVESAATEENDEKNG